MASWVDILWLFQPISWKQQVGSRPIVIDDVLLIYWNWFIRKEHFSMRIICLLKVYASSVTNAHLMTVNQSKVSREIWNFFSSVEKTWKIWIIKLRHRLCGKETAPRVRSFWCLALYSHSLCSADLSLESSKFCVLSKSSPPHRVPTSNLSTNKT